MTRYEIKKVFARRGGRVCLLLLLFFLVIVCYFAANVYYVNEEGVKEYGPSAARNLRQAQKAWAGVLDEEKLQAALEENLKVCRTPEAMSEESKERDIAFGWKQGFSEIRNLLNCSYAEDFRTYDYYLADRLTDVRTDAFYTNRVRLLREWLEGEAADQFTEKEKAYLIRQYEELDTPFFYDYMKGWRRAMEYLPTLVMLLSMLLGYLTAGIFSGEFQWKSDAVFFTSVYGRNRAVSAKIRAGLWIVTGIYWTAVCLYTAFVLAYLGADGASCPIQADFGGWKCFYHVTMLQAYALIVIGGYIGCLFLSCVTMLVSAKTRSAVIAVMIPFAAIFLPFFLSSIETPVISHILALLPDRLLQVGVAMGYFELYEIGGKICAAVPLLLGLYIILTAMLPPALYREYRRAQVRD